MLLLTTRNNITIFFVRNVYAFLNNECQKESPDI